MIIASTASLRDGFSPPLVGSALIGMNNHHNNKQIVTSSFTLPNNNKGGSKPLITSSTVEMRGSFESIKRIAGHREVRFMESQEKPMSRLQQSYEKYKSTDSLVIDMSLVGEDCESSRSSPSTSEHHADSTFSPSTTNPPTSGTFFHGSKTQTSSDFSTFNTNFHDYSAGSEQSSFEFVFVSTRKC